MDKRKLREKAQKQNHGGFKPKVKNIILIWLGKDPWFPNKLGAHLATKMKYEMKAYMLIRLRLIIQNFKVKGKGKKIDKKSRIHRQLYILLRIHRTPTSN